MGRVCTDSYYGSDWAVYSREDAIACENAGGDVEVVPGGYRGTTRTPASW